MYEEDLKVTFLIETKCKIRIIYVGCRGQRLMAKTILNFHFDYLKASLSCQGGITLNVPPSHVVDEDDDLSLRRI